GRTLELVGLIASRDIQVSLASLIEDAAARKALGSIGGTMVKQVVTEVVALSFAVHHGEERDGDERLTATNDNGAAGQRRKVLLKRKPTEQTPDVAQSSSGGQSSGGQS
ncbi:MAG: hypothetical protein NZM04_09770, partial [Methylacidiphilales bacterium]|nr:hypothetical protein [Candidatus Methylacidiphilales bacterium]